MAEFDLRVLQEKDIESVTEMEVAAWHEYYSQYKDLYAVIRHSLTHEGVARDWHKFLQQDRPYEGKMLAGGDRVAYVAFYDDKPVGIGAVSAYMDGVAPWKPVDDYIRRADGSLPLMAKYQNLYVDSAHRGKGIGHYLNIARADYMLDKGYTALFLAPYADATKTMAYHRSNGLEHIHDYMSLSTYQDGARVKIACCVNLSLRDMRDDWKKQLDDKIADGKAYSFPL